MLSESEPGNGGSTYNVEHGTVKLNRVSTRQCLIIDDERDRFKTVRIEPRIGIYAYEMGSDPEGVAVAPAGRLQRVAQIMLVVNCVEEKLRERVDRGYGAGDDDVGRHRSNVSRV